jgi:hypothetical protein
MQPVLNSERLLIGVLGNRNSGKSHTWNTLFGRTVRTGGEPRHLMLRPGESVEVFLVSGSPEERHLYVDSILSGQTCRIVLCSMQYIAEAQRTLDYFIGNHFSLYVQWLNPGFSDQVVRQDNLGLIDRIVDTQHSVVAVRDGRPAAERRVQELREFIYGWALYRDLIIRGQ